MFQSNPNWLWYDRGELTEWFVDVDIICQQLEFLCQSKRKPLCFLVIGKWERIQKENHQGKALWCLLPLHALKRHIQTEQKGALEEACVFISPCPLLWSLMQLALKRTHGHRTMNQFEGSFIVLFFCVWMEHKTVQPAAQVWLWSKNI